MNNEMSRLKPFLTLAIFSCFLSFFFVCLSNFCLESFFVLSYRSEKQPATLSIVVFKHAAEKEIFCLNIFL